MPRYPHRFSYSKEVVKGLASKPENRIEAVRPLIETAGGKLFDAYYTLGDSDRRCAEGSRKDRYPNRSSSCARPIEEVFGYTPGLAVTRLKVYA